MNPKSANAGGEGAQRRPIMRAFELLGQRWTLRILWELREERLTFRALQSRCGEVSPTVLNRRLKELRASAILDHNAEGYGLTKCGQELGHHLLAFNDWATRWAEQLGADHGDSL